MKDQIEKKMLSSVGCKIVGFDIQTGTGSLHMSLACFSERDLVLLKCCRQNEASAGYLSRLLSIKTCGILLFFYKRNTVSCK